MRVAFDWDDTLVPTTRAFPALEPRGHLARALRAEPLRAGAVDLWRWLRAGDHEVWVYTFSPRWPASIRRTLWCHGLAPADVVNGPRHRAALADRPALAHLTKYPPAWEIDLLVEDSAVVAAEGAALGFDVVLTLPDDPHWSAAVQAAVEARRPGQ